MLHALFKDIKGAARVNAILNEFAPIENENDKLFDEFSAMYDHLYFFDEDAETESELALALRRNFRAYAMTYGANLDKIAAAWRAASAGNTVKENETRTRNTTSSTNGNGSVEERYNPVATASSKLGGATDTTTSASGSSNENEIKTATRFTGENATDALRKAYDLNNPVAAFVNGYATQLFTNGQLWEVLFWWGWR